MTTYDSAPAPRFPSSDPEIAKLQRESLRLIIASEKVLTALENHVELLRTFIKAARSAAGEEGTDVERPSE